MVSVLRATNDLERLFVDLGDHYAEKVVVVNEDGSVVGGGGGGVGLTDTELRASPVNVDINKPNQIVMVVWSFQMQEVLVLLVVMLMMELSI